MFEMDVKTAFLNDNLEEEIYMDQPIDFVSKGREGNVHRLKTSICDLKQSSSSWYSRFHKAILAYLYFQETIVYVELMIFC